MIKSQEVHIGNYFNVPRKGQSPFRVDLMEYVTADFCKVGMNVNKFEFQGKLIDGHPLTWEIQDLEGIILTEELLLKCGGEIKPFSLGITLDRFRFLWKEEYKYWYVIASDPGGAYMNKIEFLHELQNFYRVMNGQELGVKL